MRVNARLDDTYQTKIEYLKNQTGWNMTELLKEAIDQLYSTISKKPQHSLFDHLEEIGFIGAGDGAKDLSINYKEWVRQEVHEKHSR